MKETRCPICYDELEVIETTPCICCGSEPDKVLVLKQDIEERYIHDSFAFSIYRAFEKIEVPMCDRCPFNFTSFSPELLGFGKGRKMWSNNFQFLRHIDKPTIGKDKFCRSCGLRLAFIKFQNEISRGNE